MLFDRMISLCESKGISLWKLERTLGFGNATLAKWSKTSPGIDKVQRVADYFGVSVDYLLDRDDKIELSADSKIIAITFDSMSAEKKELLGKQVSTNNAVASSATSAAAATNALASATKAAGDAADDSTASWDQLNVLQKDTPTTSADGTTPATTSTTGTGTGAGQELGSGVTVSPDVQKAADTIKGIFDDLSNAFAPTKQALSGLWEQFQRLGTFSWDALKDFYNDFLVPVGKWVLGVGLPGFITAMSDGMSKINWGNINKALKDLWTVLTPFAVNVGSGLLWFWDNVLVPLGTWTMNNIVPLFLGILKDAISLLNGVINDLKPLAQWLFDNFLKPLAEWTGGVRVGTVLATGGGR